MARPRVEIDKEQFEKLCALQCTLDEIAGFFRCSPDTVERWTKRVYKQGFAGIYKIHSAGGKMSLRRMQFRLAEKSAAMAIFLGKQYLGQRDSFADDARGDGRLAQLITGLQEARPEDDLHAQAAGADEAVAGEQAEADQPA